ncbi:hypothetical protein [Streptomyces sp. NPDC088748]|uniref:hypothetical protein n=1 Tax=Streptomyces sp. NPDC088748 TaxID=3365887 RepID=UPI00381CF37A
MNEIDRAPIEDTYFGAITVRLNGQDRIEVDGEAIPRVTLERDPAAEADPQIAIGTRDPAHLTMRLDGAPVGLLPAKGRLTRHSYRWTSSTTGRPTAWSRTPSRAAG